MLWLLIKEGKIRDTEVSGNVPKHSPNSNVLPAYVYMAVNGFLFQVPRWFFERTVCIYCIQHNVSLCLSLYDLLNFRVSL